MRKVEEISLSYNKIEFLPRNLFRNYLKLVKIDFSKNPIKIIDVDFTELPELKYLYLDGSLCVNHEIHDHEIKT